MTPDNKFIISGSSDKSIKVFDFETRELVHKFEKAHLGKNIRFYHQ